LFELLISAITEPVIYTRTAFAEVREIELEDIDPVEMLKERAYWIAVNSDFSWTTLSNVIDAETGGTWDCSKVGKAGELGCLQIIPKFHPTVDPLNFDEAVKYFISEYKAGRGWQWTSLSCVKYVRAMGVTIPTGMDADMFHPNSRPTAGSVAIFKYKNSSHVGYVSRFTANGFIMRESNFESEGKISTREVSFSDPFLLGFWNPVIDV